MRGIAALILGLFIWALCACGTTATLQRGIEITEKGAKAMDIGLDVGTDAWTAAVAARIGYCRAKGMDTPDARRACLGIFAEGDQVVPALEQASAAYDALVEALAVLGDMAKKLEPYLQAARKADK